MADTWPLPTNDRLTITCHLRFSRAEQWGPLAVGQNVRVRKLLIGVVAAVTTLAVTVVGADFGAAIYAEYRWSRSVRAANALDFDPWVSILGFPFTTQAMRHAYGEVELRASGVPHPTVGKVSLEATMHDVDVMSGNWLVSPDSTLSVGELESRIIVDSTHVGRFMGVKDLLIEAPTDESNDPASITESGISDPNGIVLTGTPRSAGLTERVSVSVDVSVSGPDKNTLVITATKVMMGPGTADEEVPDDKRNAVLAAFTTSIPGLALPFGVAPTSPGARGSDLIIEGITTGVTVELDGFRRS